MATLEKSNPNIVTGTVGFRSSTDCTPVRVQIGKSPDGLPNTHVEYECGYINVMSDDQVSYLWLIPKAALSAIMMAQKQSHRHPSGQGLGTT